MNTITPLSNRRGFLRKALYGAGFLAGSGCLNSRAAFVAPELKPHTADMLQRYPVRRPVRIGAPLFGENLGDPEVWARTAKAQGYRAVYAPGVSLNDLPRVQAFVKAAEANDLVIAEVGRWVNLMDADEAKRKKNFDNVAEGLALADELNARCCVDIAGSFSPESWMGPHPRNLTREHFDLTVENARKLIDAVKPKRTVFAYEAMGWMYPDSSDSYLALIKAVDRKAFGVHLDICNMVNDPIKFWDNAALIHEAFDKLGPWIASCHAKDLRWNVELNVHFVECEIGKGVIDYATYIRRLAALDHDVPLMIEHMSGQQEYERCRDHLLAVVAKTV